MPETYTENTLDEMRLLYETSQRISMALDMDEITRAYLEQVATRGIYACTIVLYEMDNTGQRMTRVELGRWSPQEGLVQPGVRHPYTYDNLDPALDAGQTITISDVYTDPNVPLGLREMQAQVNRPAIAMIPLMVGDRRIGLVVLSYPDAHQWSDVSLRPYLATAAQLATAIDNRIQQNLVIQRTQRLAALEERQRLARDLHDSVTQILFSLTLIAQSVAPAWHRSPAEGEKRITRLLELSGSALAEMRALVAKFRNTEALPANNYLDLPGTVQLRQRGLVAAIYKYLAAIAHDDITIQFDTDNYSRQPYEFEETLYRIIQEALNNIVKYARAKVVRIQLEIANMNILLSISDDGIGFSPKAVPPTPTTADQGGFGLRTMRERVHALGGTLEFQSYPGGGTTLYVVIPQVKE